MLEEEDETFWNTDREIRDVETEETSPVREEGGESTCRKDSLYKSYISHTGDKSGISHISNTGGKSDISDISNADNKSGISYKGDISNTGEKSNKNDINDKSDKSPVLSLDDW